MENVEEVTDIVSGAKSSRQGLDRLMLAVRRGKVGVVVCFKLDRLGWSLAHLAQIIGEFAAHNVALVVPSQGIDTSASNPAARLQLNVLCAVAEFEREVIRERVNAGLAVAKAKGVRLGRPPAHNGQRTEVARLRSEGMSYRAISKQLGVPVSSVRVKRSFWISYGTYRKKRSRPGALDAGADGPGGGRSTGGGDSLDGFFDRR